MKRFLLATSCCAFLLVPALYADAQSGPAKSGPSSGPSGVKQMPAVGQAFNPARAVKMLQARGATTESKTTDAANGTKVVRVTVNLDQDNFKYVFDVVFVTPANGTTLWLFSSVLNTNAKNIPLDKLQGLLKENNVMAGDSAFMINPQWALVLSSRSYAGNITDQLLQGDINRFMRDIRETSTLWYVVQ